MRHGDKVLYALLHESMMIAGHTRQPPAIAFEALDDLARFYRMAHRLILSDVSAMASINWSKPALPRPSG